MRLQGHLARHAEPGRQPDGQSPVRVLELLVGWERSIDANPDVEEEFSIDVMKALDFEPLSIYELAPEGWRVDRPGLVLHTELTRGVLQVTVLPRRDRGSRRQDGRWCFDELGRFDTTDSKPPRPVTVLKLNVGRSVKAGRDGAQQRGIVFGLYEFIIQRLAMHFDCRVQAGLVCYGSENELDVRVVARKDEVQLANLLPYDGAELWHPELATLCKEVGIEPRDALDFYRKKLKNLPRGQWAETWAGYCGQKVERWHGYGREQPLPQVLKVLEIVDDPVTWPPLRAGSDEARAVLRRLEEAEGPQMLVLKLSGAYLLGLDTAWDVVAEVDRELYERLPRDVGRLMDELTTLAGKGEGDTPFARALRKQLLEWAQASWDAASGTRWDVKLRRAMAGARIDVPGLLAWSRERAPEFHEWLQGAEARFKPRLRRSAGK